jgi:hypothetical protein
MNGEEATSQSTKSSFALLVVASQTFTKEQKEQVLRKVKSSKPFIVRVVLPVANRSNNHRLLFCSRFVSN